MQAYSGSLKKKKALFQSNKYAVIFQLFGVFIAVYQKEISIVQLQLKTKKK